MNEKKPPFLALSTRQTSARPHQSLSRYLFEALPQELSSQATLFPVFSNAERRKGDTQKATKGRPQKELRRVQGRR